MSAMLWIPAAGIALFIATLQALCAWQRCVQRRLDDRAAMLARVKL